MELERERGITIKAQAVRVLWKGHELEPDRHARARRLHLRGVAVAAGVRGRAARRRRGAGDRGADARERLPGDRERPRDRPGREQDRPAAGRSRRRRGARSPSSSATTPDHVLRISAKTGRGRRGRARRDRRAHPGAVGRRRTRRARALIFDSSYDQYRGVVAFVRVVDGAFRDAATRLRAMAQGTRFEAEELGFLSPERCGRSKALAAGEVGYVITGLKDVSRAARRRHADRRAAARRRAAAGLQGRQADGLRRALPDGLRRVPRAARRAREAEAERRARSSTSRRPRRRSASASAAASSACCTWRSSASGSSASSTSTCS